MERVFKYRPHIQKMQYVVPGFLLLIGLGLPIVLFILAGFKMVTAIPSLAVCVVLTIEAVFIYFFFRRFAKVQCILGEDRITYHNVKGTTTIMYEAIDRIEFPSVKYMGGWVKIVSGDQTIRLTVVIKNIQDFVKALKETLDEKEVTYHYEEKKYQSFLRTATYSDYSWERVYKIWWKLIVATIVTTGIAVIINVVQQGGFSLGLSVLLSYLLPTLVYLVCEVFLGKGLAKRFNETEVLIPIRDLAYEDKIYSYGKYIGSGVFFVYCLILIL